MIQAVRGTKDILPVDITKWHYIENIIRNITERYNYKEIRTPIFEKTEVFSRSIGENTDIVNKEMYTFNDKGGDSITLRPEQTAALIRSVIQNNLTNDISTLRLWYLGPYFRYERPQKGRLRQFHQFGVECIASPNPEADAEIILLANQLIKNLGINDYELQINSLGNEISRSNYRNKLVEYLTIHKNDLSEESKSRFETNPLRILDSKDDRDKSIIKNAPKIIDFLDEESSKHFESVKNLLDSTGVKYKIESDLVRGLDYYCHTVFEFRSSLLGAQDAFGGGGRYDGLIKQLGGKDAPAVGFAMGVERLILILDSLNVFNSNESKCDFFIVSSNEKYYSTALLISEELRNLNYNVINDLQRKSFKAQMREADKSGAKFCIIFAEDEFNRNSILVKNMKTGEQSEIKIENIKNTKF